MSVTSDLVAALQSDVDDIVAFARNLRPQQRDTALKSIAGILGTPTSSLNETKATRFVQSLLAVYDGTVPKELSKILANRMKHLLNTPSSTADQRLAAIDVIALLRLKSTRAADVIALLDSALKDALAADNTEVREFAKRIVTTAHPTSRLRLASLPRDRMPRGAGVVPQNARRVAAAPASRNSRDKKKPKR
jgi:hypothetical protein